MARGRNSDPSGPVGRDDRPPPPTPEPSWEATREAFESHRQSGQPRPRSKAAARQQRARQNARAREVARGKQATVLSARQDEALRSWQQLRAAAATRRPDLVPPIEEKAGTTPPTPVPPPHHSSAPVTVKRPRVVPAASSRPDPQQPARRRPGAVVLLASAVALTVATAGVLASIFIQGAPEQPTSAQATVKQSADPQTGGERSPEMSSAPSRPGRYVETRLVSDGRLRSDHYIVTRQPTETVKLRIRPLAGYDSVVPVVRRLEVFADGRPVPLTGSGVSGTEVRTVSLSKPTTVVHLRYVTSGAVQKSALSSSRRALVLADPLRADVGSPLPAKVVQLTGADVLSLACVSGQRLPQPCGRPDESGDGWRVQLQPSDEVSGVLAQVDLPTT